MYMAQWHFWILRLYDHGKGFEEITYFFNWRLKKTELKFYVRFITQSIFKLDFPALKSSSLKGKNIFVYISANQWKEGTLLLNQFRTTIGRHLYLVTNEFYCGAVLSLDHWNMHLNVTFTRIKIPNGLFSKKDMPT